MTRLLYDVAVTTHRHDNGLPYQATQHNESTIVFNQKIHEFVPSNQRMCTTNSTNINNQLLNPTPSLNTNKSTLEARTPNVPYISSHPVSGINSNTNALETDPPHVISTELPANISPRADNIEEGLQKLAFQLCMLNANNNENNNHSDAITQSSSNSSIIQFNNGENGVTINDNETSKTNLPSSETFLQEVFLRGAINQSKYLPPHIKASSSEDDRWLSTSNEFEALSLRSENWSSDSSSKPEISDSSCSGKSSLNQGEIISSSSNSNSSSSEHLFSSHNSEIQIAQSVCGSTYESLSSHPSTSAVAVPDHSDTGIDSGEVINETNNTNNNRSLAPKPSDSFCSSRLASVLGRNFNGTKANDSGFMNNTKNESRNQNAKEKAPIEKKPSCVSTESTWETRTSNNTERSSSQYLDDSVFISTSTDNGEYLHQPESSMTDQLQKLTISNESQQSFNFTENISVKPIICFSEYDAISPFNCRIDHNDDFVSFSRFFSTNYKSIIGNKPEQLRRNQLSLLSISHRIVRIKVCKPYYSFSEYTSSRNNNINKHSSSYLSSNECTIAPLSDHYGTGFAYFINDKYIEIRTHAHLLKSAAETEKAEVQFNLFLPERKEWLLVTCQGQSQGYLMNEHSYTCTFRCNTPLELKPWLYLFKKVPIHVSTSFFDDSGISTDANTKLNISEESGNLNQLGNAKKPNSDASLREVGVKDNDIPMDESDDESINNQDSGKSNARYVETNPDINGDSNDSDYYMNDLGVDKNLSREFEENYYDDDEDNVCGIGENTYLNHPESNEEAESQESGISLMDCVLGVYNIKGEGNPFEYCGTNESVVKCAFASMKNLSSMRIADISESNFNNHSSAKTFGTDDRTVSTKQNTMGTITHGLTKSRRQAKTFSADSVTFGPDHPMSKGYYQSFSNVNDGQDFANSDIPTGFLDSSILGASSSAGWMDYESTIYLQSHYREELATFRNHKQHQRTDDHRDQRMYKDLCAQFIPVNIGQNQHQEANSATTESDSWDSDLLGLDQTDMIPSVLIDKDEELEQIVADIISDDDSFDISSHYDQQISSQFENTAIIVSYTHGNVFKVVSKGSLALSGAPMGDLYDVPSCFGCCGAPVLSYTKKGDLFVTSLVHNGTSKSAVNGHYSGFGLYHLPQSSNEFTQCNNI